LTPFVEVSIAALNHALASLASSNFLSMLYDSFLVHPSFTA